MKTRYSRVDGLDDDRADDGRTPQVANLGSSTACAVGTCIVDDAQLPTAVWSRSFTTPR